MDWAPVSQRIWDMKYRFRDASGAGDIDLQGTWNYATMTPLERPRDLADKAVLSPEEAAAYERSTNQRQRAANNTAGPDWWDPGTQQLVDRRTSLVDGWQLH